jgi:hypothetical protein
MNSSCARHLWIGLAVMACSGGNGGGDPVSPVTLQVAGTWTETSQIVFNPCEIPFPSSITGTVQLTQSGTQLTVIDNGETLGTGTLNLTTGDFTLSGTSVEDGVTTTIVQSGRFSSSTRFTSETVITATDGVIICIVRTNDTGSR